MVFVFDNWQAVEGTEKGEKDLRDQLVGLASCQLLITARSADAQSAKKLHQSCTVVPSEGMRCDCYARTFSVDFLHRVFPEQLGGNESNSRDGEKEVAGVFFTAEPEAGVGPLACCLTSRLESCGVWHPWH